MTQKISIKPAVSFFAGVLVEFISQPVTVGFTTATSVIIIASQLKGLLGLSYGSGNFLSTLRAFFDNVHDTQWPDTVLGFSCIAVLLFLRVRDTLRPQFKLSMIFVGYAYAQSEASSIRALTRALIIGRIDIE